MTSRFADMTSSSSSFDVCLFFLSSLVTGQSFMSISWLVLELWQFFFIKNRLEIRKLEIPPSRFCAISGYWDELVIPKRAWMSLMKSYWMLQNTRVTAFTVSKLLKGETNRGVKLPPLPTQYRVKTGC